MRTLLACILFLSFSHYASGHHYRDTVHFKATLAEKKALVLSDSALNEIGIDSLLNKIENVHTTLNHINQVTGTGFNTLEIEENLPEIDSNIDIIDENVTLYSSVLDVKNLQMFNVLLNNLQEQLTDWRTTVFKYNKDLVEMSDAMTAFRRDTILKALIADSAFRSLYLNEITDLKSKWKTAKTAISTNLTHIGQLQASLSNEYFTTIDLQNKIRDLLRKIGSRSRGKEYNYLWDVSGNVATVSGEANEMVQKSYKGQRKILIYYFRRNWTDLFWMVFAGGCFALWIFRNFRKIKKTTVPADIHVQSLDYIKKLPILATLVVLFNLAPFFDIHPPTAYVEITEFLLVVTLTWLLWRNWPVNLFYYWIVIGIFYIVFSSTGTFLTPTFGFRLLLLILNLAATVFGIFWFRMVKKHTLIFSVMIRFVSVVFIILNCSAVLCNLYGRLSLAKIFSVTGIYGLTQIIGLSIFIQVVTEAFHLQTIVSKLKGGLAAKLNFTRMQQLLSRVLIFIAVVIWSIVFSISLNIYNLLFRILTDFLTRPRSVGGASFEVGNILLFLGIIYVSNLLQQGIGSLYGKPQGNWDPEVKKNGSRLAMTRLIFIVIGFLIAVAASGLPMDKITIVLGALGVGIGLGLQSIVNNLVSGVILIFEQPFRIGDYIEIGDKKGRVLDISIRSSKLVTEEGAEVIMPNADLLSGRVINWTNRNDNVRIELKLSVQTSHSFEEIKKIILDEIAGNDHVIGNIPAEVILSAVTANVMTLTILIWINDVHRQQYIKSELLNSIHSKLRSNEIQVV